MRKKFALLIAVVVLIISASSVAFAASIPTKAQQDKVQNLYVDGNKVDIPSSMGYLFVDNSGRTMVPLRAIMDSFDCTVEWDASTQKITITGNGKTIIFTVGLSSYLLDGQSYSMDTSPVIIDGRTHVPLRFAAESLDASVTTTGNPPFDINISSAVITPASSTSASSYAEQVVTLVNVEREKNGLDPLVMDESLNAVADIRVEETVSTFSHTRPDGSDCFSALDEKGVSYMGAGENIAMGQQTPEEVVETWMNSTGHRENILGNYTKIGVSCYKNGSTYYWVQVFTR